MAPHKEGGRDGAGTKKDDQESTPVVFGASAQLNQNESLPNLLDAILDVKLFAKMEFGVEELRPSACEKCGTGRGCLGALRIHGHGTRPRDVWGPPRSPEGTPSEITELRLRRFRCLDCDHVMTVRPPFLARYFRYATAAIALALWLSAAMRRPATVVRAELSPWPIRGFSEPHRWRSLGRWLGRLDDLFGLPCDLGEAGPGLGRRAARMLCARAPPDLRPRLRAFVGAQLR